MAYCTSLGLFTSAFTNGYLINKPRAEKIIAAGLNSLTVSIDGPDAELNDVLRGVKGAFERAVDGIQVLRATQKELAAMLPEIAIHCTVSARNFLRLPEMVDLARSLGGGRIRFQYLSSVSAEARERTNRMMGETVIDAHTFADLGQGMCLGEEQLERFDEVIASIGERAGADVRCELDPALVRGDKELLAQGTFPVKACQMPWRTAIISPIGDVVPCSMYTAYRMGNLKEATFEAIWSGKRARHLRGKLGDGLPPVCQSCCSVHESDPPLWKRTYEKLHGRMVKNLFEVTSKGRREA